MNHGSRGSRESQQLKCVVCDNILKGLQGGIARGYVAWGYRLCATCFEYVKANSPLKDAKLMWCPIENGVMNVDKEFKYNSLRPVINALPINCSFYQRGCKWNGKLIDLQTHKSGCKFSSVQNVPQKPKQAPSTSNFINNLQKRRQASASASGSLCASNAESNTFLHAIGKRMLDLEVKLRMINDEKEALKKTKNENSALLQAMGIQLLEFEKKLLKTDEEKEILKKTEKGTTCMMNAINQRLAESEWKLQRKDEEIVSLKEDLKDTKETLRKIPKRFEKSTTNLVSSFTEQNEYLRKKVDELTKNGSLNDEKNEKFKEKIDLLTKTLEVKSEQEIVDFNEKNVKLEEKVDALIQTLHTNDDTSLSVEMHIDTYKKENEANSLQNEESIKENSKGKKKRYKKVHHLLSSYESLSCVGELQKTSSTVLLCNSDNRDVVLMNAEKSSDDTSNDLDTSDAAVYSITSNEPNDQNNQSITSNESSEQNNQYDCSITSSECIAPLDKSNEKSVQEDKRAKSSSSMSEIDFKMDDSKEQQQQSEYEDLNQEIVNEGEDSSLSSDDDDNGDDNNIMYKDDEIVKISIRDFKNYMKELNRTEKGKAIKKLKNSVSIINRQLFDFQAKVKGIQKNKRDTWNDDIIIVFEKKLNALEQIVGSIKNRNDVQTEHIENKEKEHEDVVVDAVNEAMIVFNTRIKELEKVTFTLLQKEKHQNVVDSLKTKGKKEVVPFSDVDEGVSSLDETDEKSRSNEQLNSFVFKPFSLLNKNQTNATSSFNTDQPFSQSTFNNSPSPVNINQRITNIENSIKMLDEVRIAAVHVHINDRIGGIEKQLLTLQKQEEISDNIEALKKETIKEIEVAKKDLVKNVHLVNESYETVLIHIDERISEKGGVDSCKEVQKSLFEIEKQFKSLKEGLDKCVKDVEGSKNSDNDGLKKCVDLYSDMETKFGELVKFVQQGNNSNTKSIDGLNKTVQELEKKICKTEDKESSDSCTVHDSSYLCNSNIIQKQGFQNLKKPKSAIEGKIQKIELSLQAINGHLKESPKEKKSIQSLYKTTQGFEKRICKVEETLKNSNQNINKPISFKEERINKVEQTQQNLNKSLSELEHRLLFVMNDRIRKVEYVVSKVSLANVIKKLDEFDPTGKSLQEVFKKMDDIEINMSTLKDMNKQSYDDINKKLATLKDNSPATKNDSTNNVNKKSILESQVQSIKDSNRNLTTTVNTINKRLFTLEGKIVSTKQLNDTVEEHEDCLKDLVEGIESAEKQILALEKKVGELSKSKEEITTDPSQSKFQLHINKLEKEILKMKDDIVELKKSLQELNKKETADESEIDKVNRELDDLKTKVSNNATVTCNLETKMMEKINELKKHSNGNLASVLSRVSILEKDIQALNNVVEKDMSNKIEDLEKKAQHLSTVVDKIINDDGEKGVGPEKLKKIENELKDVKVKSNEVKTSISNLNKRASCIEKNNLQSKDKLDGRLNGLEYSLTILQNKIDGFESGGHKVDGPSDLKMADFEKQVSVIENKMDNFEANCKDFILNTFDDFDVKMQEFKENMKDLKEKQESDFVSVKKTDLLPDDGKQQNRLIDLEMADFDIQLTLLMDNIDDKIDNFEGNCKEYIVNAFNDIDVKLNEFKGVEGFCSEKLKKIEYELKDVKVKSNEVKTSISNLNKRASCIEKTHLQSTDKLSGKINGLEYSLTIVENKIDDFESGDEFKEHKNTVETDVNNVRIMRSMADFDLRLIEMMTAFSSLKNSYYSGFDHVNKSIESLKLSNRNSQLSIEIDGRVKEVESGIVYLENYLSITNMRVQKLRRKYGGNKSETESEDEDNMENTNNKEVIAVGDNITNDIDEPLESYDKSTYSCSLLTQEGRDELVHKEERNAVFKNSSEPDTVDILKNEIEKDVQSEMLLSEKCYKTKVTKVDTEVLLTNKDVCAMVENESMKCVEKVASPKLSEIVEKSMHTLFENEPSKEGSVEGDKDNDFSKTVETFIPTLTSEDGEVNNKAYADESSEKIPLLEQSTKMDYNSSYEIESSDVYIEIAVNSVAAKLDDSIEEKTKIIKESLKESLQHPNDEAPSHNDSKELSDPQNESWIFLPDEKPEEKLSSQNDVV